MSILALKLWKAASSPSSLELGTLALTLTLMITGPTAQLLTKTSDGKPFDYVNLSDILLLRYFNAANLRYSLNKHTLNSSQAFIAGVGN